MRLTLAEVGAEVEIGVLVIVRRWAEKGAVVA